MGTGTPRQRGRASTADPRASASGNNSESERVWKRVDPEP
jgi:hypothetical protein